MCVVLLVTISWGFFFWQPGWGHPDVSGVVLLSSDLFPVAGSLDATETEVVEESEYLRQCIKTRIFKLLLHQDCFSYMKSSQPMSLPVRPVSITLQQYWRPRGRTGGGGISWHEDHLQLPMGTGAPGDAVEQRQHRAAADTQRGPLQTAGQSFYVCIQLLLCQEPCLRKDGK